MQTCSFLIHVLNLSNTEYFLPFRPYLDLSYSKCECSRESTYILWRDNLMRVFRRETLFGFMWSSGLRQRQRMLT
jgi:hypothetical protein